MLYIIAFMANNAIWCAMYYIVIDLTFWIGTIITMCTVCKMRSFLTQTIRKISLCEEPNIQFRQIRWNKMQKLNTMKCRTYLMITINILLLIPITWELWSNGYEVMAYFIYYLENGIWGDIKDMDTQTYPTFIQFVGFNIFLIAIDLEMIAWTYQGSKWCTMIDKHSICMRYFLCRDPKNGKYCNKCLCKKCVDVSIIDDGRSKHGLNEPNLSVNLDTSMISSYHLEYNITEYHVVDESVDT